jgi:hypothetical protein
LEYPYRHKFSFSVHQPRNPIKRNDNKNRTNSNLSDPIGFYLGRSTRRSRPHLQEPRNHAGSGAGTLDLIHKRSKRE